MGSEEKEMRIYRIVFYGAFLIFLIAWISHWIFPEYDKIFDIVAGISASIVIIAYLIRWKPWRREKKEPKGPGGIIY